MQLGKWIEQVHKNKKNKKRVRQGCVFSPEYIMSGNKLNKMRYYPVLMVDTERKLYSILFISKYFTKLNTV